ncbi:hypothetical protein [Amycolatopsis sp. lyj-84]|uniref:hypothetical protein n=1 Tax=Amycolatopsis sp. lyj-84 TaxID=2789284 RepID=UPI0039789AE9
MSTPPPRQARTVHEGRAYRTPSSITCEWCGFPVLWFSPGRYVNHGDRIFCAPGIVRARARRTGRHGAAA